MFGRKFHEVLFWAKTAQRIVIGESVRDDLLNEAVFGACFFDRIFPFIGTFVEKSHN